MSDAWRLVLDEDAFQFVLGRRVRERQALFKALDSIKAEPGQEPDFKVGFRRTD